LRFTMSRALASVSSSLNCRLTSTDRSFTFARFHGLDGELFFYSCDLFFIFYPRPISEHHRSSRHFTEIPGLPALSPLSLRHKVPSFRGELISALRRKMSIVPPLFSVSENKCSRPLLYLLYRTSNLPHLVQLRPPPLLPNFISFLTVYCHLPLPFLFPPPPLLLFSPWLFFQEWRRSNFFLAAAVPVCAPPCVPGAQALFPISCRQTPFFVNGRR